jgi:hypothetical protein
MSVVLTLRYHDSEPGGGICKDDADAKAEAAKVAREVLENYNPSAEELDEKIRDFLTEQDGGENVESRDARLDREERLGVEDLDDDEALDFAAEDMEFEWDTLPGGPDVDGDLPDAARALLAVVATLEPGDLADPDNRAALDAARQRVAVALSGGPAPEPTGPTPVVVIAAGVRCALAVIEAWEDGDLAATVRELAEWTRDARKDFPDLDLEGAPGTTEDEVSLCVLDIKPGDRVDLKGVYAEDSTDANAAEFEYGRVIGAERETDDCMRLDFENFTSFGFEAWRDLPVIKGTAADRLFYAEGEE